MGREISDFDTWLQDIGGDTRGLPLAPALGSIARSARDDFGARLWFVEILGRRWSYIAGEVGDEPSQSETFCIPLDEKVSLVSDRWGDLSDVDRGRLISFVRKLVSSRRQR